MRTRGSAVQGGRWAVAAVCMPAAGCAAGALPDPQPFAATQVDFGDDSSGGDDDGSTSDAGDGDESTTRVDPVDDDDTGAAETGPECPVGSDGCPCTMGDGCDVGLSCVGGTCGPAPPECGNGLQEDPEECDHGTGNGDTNLCKSDCTEQVCGDGFVGPGEACDDADRDDIDECSNTCALTSCGDGVVQTGEECDDADADDTDECLATCLDAECGDGVVHAGVEECDDANEVTTDACPSACEPASCGDSFVWDGEEECDDGNANADDGCTGACACRWTFSSSSHIAGWSLAGDWALYTAAPTSSNPAVTFVTQGQVFGTDGNRAAPYPGSELETSTATTPDFPLPASLQFLSWHVDEGGGNYDRKRIEISTDGGGSWTIVVDCAAGPNDDLPFCSAEAGPREQDDFDEISVDVSSFAGDTGRVRFTYDTVDSCCSFEQGWFIDLANLLDCS